MYLHVARIVAVTSNSDCSFLIPAYMYVSSDHQFMVGGLPPTFPYVLSIYNMYNM